MITAILHTTTTLSDSLYLVGFSLPAALIPHAIRGAFLHKNHQKRDSSRLPHNILTDPASLQIRRFHWSLASVVLSWLPFLMMSLGYVGCSLLRDAGHQIFPWPLLAVSILFALTFGASQYLRHRMIQNLPSDTLNK
ncbi:MAG: hypothetical protein JWL81_1214 [Verrucomicrobiales bacterium]|nr:hypothetical protein [Verrucomicrobiales bacterium]